MHRICAIPKGVVVRSTARVMKTSPIILICFFMNAVIGKYPLYSYQTALTRLSVATHHAYYYEQLERRLMRIYRPEINIELVMKANATLNLTSECRYDMQAILNELLRGNFTVFQWLGAMGRPIPGAPGEANIWPGSFELCMSMPKNILPRYSEMPAKYCTILIRSLPKLPISTDVHSGLQFGLCLPRSCSTNDTVHIAQSVLSWVNFDVDEEASYCHSSPEVLPKDRWFWLAILLIVTCFLLILVGLVVEWIMTVTHIFILIFAAIFIHIVRKLVEELIRRLFSGLTEDIHSPSSPHEGGEIRELPVQGLLNDDEEYEKFRLEFIRRSNFFGKIGAAFAWPHNIHKLWSFPTRREKSDSEGILHPHQLSCLDGIRVFTALWITFGNCIIFSILVSSNALTYMRESFQNWPFQVMLAAPFAVDTFYLMSGLLTFYLAASRFEAVQEGCLPCIKFWFVHAVHRFLRLTPPYLLVVFIYAGLFPHLYDGPLFPQRIELTDVNYCRQHWWITYFSNFFYTKEQCLPWTWYLANEFQFSGFLAPVFITVTKWNARVGVMFAVVLLTSSIASTFGIVYMNESFQGHLTATSFDLLLVKPYTHWGTYTMGLFFGWILFKRKQQGTLRRNSRREQLFVVSALALVSTFCLSSLYGFGGATSTSGPHSLSKFTFTLNTALSRPAFALALAIVIYLCGTDNAPYFNAFLSWPGFRLPSQLTYGLSLIHPIYVYLILMRLQTPITLSSATLVILFVAVSVISFISSFFLFLVTEIPVRTLEQFYGRR